MSQNKLKSNVSEHWLSFTELRKPHLAAQLENQWMENGTETGTGMGNGNGNLHKKLSD